MKEYRGFRIVTAVPNFWTSSAMANYRVDRKTSRGWQLVHQGIVRGSFSNLDAAHCAADAAAREWIDRDCPIPAPRRDSRSAVPQRSGSSSVAGRSGGSAQGPSVAVTSTKTISMSLCTLDAPQVARRLGFADGESPLEGVQLVVDAATAGLAQGEGAGFTWQWPDKIAVTDDIGNDQIVFALLHVLRDGRRVTGMRYWCGDGTLSGANLLVIYE